LPTTSPVSAPPMASKSPTWCRSDASDPGAGVLRQEADHVGQVP
jgi:hypothetical protein